MKLVTWRTLPPDVGLPNDQRWATAEVDEQDEGKQEASLVKQYGPNIPPPDGKVFVVDTDSQPSWTVTISVKQDKK